MTELRQIPGEIEDTPFLKPIFDSVKEGLEEVNKITAEDGGLYEQSKAAAVTGDMVYTLMPKTKPSPLPTGWMTIRKRLKGIILPLLWATPPKYQPPPKSFLP